jgi:3-hydroxyacyl-[acyl-carrier-protein] dehydratase
MGLFFFLFRRFPDKKKNLYFCLFIYEVTMQFLDNLFITQSITDTENGFTAVLRCNPEHLIYQAHFPGNPITPGACLLQTAGEILQRKLGRPIYLKSSKNIKYLNVLIPAEDKEVCFVFSNLAETETECKAQVVITDEAQVYTKMSLTFCYEAL